MTELAPSLEPMDIELESGLSLIPHSPEHPGGRAFVIWDGEAIVGGVALVPKNEATAQISYWLDESLPPNGYLAEALPALPEQAFAEAGFDKLTITVATDDTPVVKTLERLGFRLAEIDNAKRTWGLELYADEEKISFPPVRVDLDNLDINRLA
jgi:RimJ/RimL family protein N-acetyltransferase